MNQLLQRDWLRFLILGFFFSGLVVNPGVANPLGEAVRSGEVQFERTDGGLRILQGSDRAIIDWESFSISANEFTEFVQPSERSAALNRVRGVTASQIDGALRANGNVLLINPNGIIIGPSGTIDVNGFIASTLDISDGEFLAGGDLNFRGESQQGIVNLGRISATGGDIFLIAATVENSGTIEAPNGTVGLAAGNDVLLKASDDGSGERIFVRGASGGKKANGVVNKGTIDANIAELKAHGGNVYALAVKNEGRVAATGVTKTGGQIFLSAGGNGTKIRNEGTLKATRQNGDGGRIEINAGPGGTVENAGEIDASSEAGQGGQIFIIGSQIVLERGSLVIADGATGGGEIFIGGGQRGEDGELMNAENVTVEAGTTISANATNSGNGGRVILFAENRLDFQGDVSAMGGPNGGNGGFVELSGKNSVNFRSLFDQVKVGARGGGLGGSLLFDPDDILILDGDSEGEGAIEGSPIMENEIFDQDIINFLESPEGGSLTIQTDSIGEGDGDISFENDVDITWNSANGLTFNAIRNFNLNSARIESLSSGGITVEAGGEFQMGDLGTIGGSTMTGDISITAATVDLDAGARLQSAGNLTIAPFNASSDINIGAGAIDSGLQLDAAEIGTFANGFNSITIGNLDSTIGSGKIRVTEVTFFDPTTLAVPDAGGEIFVDGQITGADNASITLDGAGPAAFGGATSTTYLSADIVTGGNDIKISDDVVVSFDRLLDTTAGGAFSAGADVQVLGTIEGAILPDSTTSNFSVDSGTAGRLDLFQSIGAGGSINTVDLTGANVYQYGIDAKGDVIIDATTDVGLFGDVAAGGFIDITAGRSISANDITIQTQTGDIDLNANSDFSGQPTTGDFSAISFNQVILNSSNGGSVYLIGTGGTAVGNIGIDLIDSSIQTTGDGAIDLIGQGGRAAKDNRGVLIRGTTSIASEDGSIDIQGVGGGFDAGEVAAASGFGIEIGTGTTVQTGTGSIYLDGDVGIKTDGVTGIGIFGTVNSLEGGEIEIVGFGDLETDNVGLFLGPGGMIGGSTSSNILIQSDTILLLGGTIQSSGDLIIAPLDPTETINIGAGAEDLGFHLDETEIARFEDGFNSITIGINNEVVDEGEGGFDEFFGGGEDEGSIRVDGFDISFNFEEESGTINVGAVTFNDPVTLAAPNQNGEIYVNGQITGAGNASITINGSGPNGGLGVPSTTYLSADIVTNGNAITIEDDVILLNGATLSTTGGEISSGADITIEGTIDSDEGTPQNLTVNAGTMGDIFFQDNVGESSRLGIVDLDARSFDLSNSLLTEGDLMIDLQESLTLNAPGTINSMGNVTINANLGASSAGAPVIIDAPIFSDSTVQIATGNGDIEINSGINAGTGLNLIGSATGDTQFFIKGTIPVAGLDVDGGGGENTLDFTGFNEGPINLSVDQLSNIQTLIGGDSAGDLLIGSATLGGTFAFGDNDAPLVYSDSSGKMIDVTEFENVEGSPEDDFFVFGDGADLFSGGIDGGGSITGDTLDFSRLNDNVDVDFGGSTFELGTGILAEFSNISNFIGATNGMNSFTGPDEATTFRITGLDTFESAGLFEVEGFENLSAGGGNSNFNFFPGGRLSGSLKGSTAGPTPLINTLSFGNFGSVVTVDLQNQTASPIGMGFSNIQSFVGSGAVGDLINLTSGNDIVEVNANNAGRVNNTTTFNSFENINSGIGSDTFNFNGLFTFTNFINGGIGNDTLNIFTDPNSTVPNPARDVFIDEGFIRINPDWNFGGFENVRVVTGNGNDNVTTRFTSFQQILIGGPGTDTLNFSQAPFGSRSPVVRGGFGPVNFGQFEILRFAPNPDTGETITPLPDPEDPVAPVVNTGDLLQIQLDNVVQDPNAAGNQGEITFTDVGGGGPGLGSDIGLSTLQNALGSFAAIAQQGIVFGGLDASGVVVVVPFSLDGSGVQPSNLGIQLLQDALAPDANTELLAALGLDLGIFLVNPDGPFAIDLSGPPALPATIQELLANISPLAQSELQNAIGVTIVVLLLPVDGAFAIDSSAAQPTPAAILIFNELLSPAAQEELNAALGIQ